jgi:tetratricopeptide (TPR) repeat protein
MKYSHLIKFVLLLTALGTLSSCSVINQIRARDQLNEGAKAYKERRFDVAEDRFQRAMTLNPSDKLAPLFLARTLHQLYLANREANVAKADQAIEIYKKILIDNPNDNASFKAVTSLLDTLKRDEEHDKWVLDRATNEKVEPVQRAESYAVLAQKQNFCANEITDTTEVKQPTVGKDGKPVYVFKKPAKTEDYEKAKQCVAKGMEIIDKAVDLIKNVNIQDPSKDNVKTAQTVWSLKSSLLFQESRLADMDGKAADKDKLVAEGKQAQEKSLAFGEEARKREEEEERKRKEAEKEAAGGGGEG